MEFTGFLSAVYTTLSGDADQPCFDVKIEVGGNTRDAGSNLQVCFEELAAHMNNEPGADRIVAKITRAVKPYVQSNYVEIASLIHFGEENDEYPGFWLLNEKPEGPVVEHFRVLPFSGDYMLVSAYAGTPVVALMAPEKIIELLDKQKPHIKVRVAEQKGERLAVAAFDLAPLVRAVEKNADIILAQPFLGKVRADPAEKIIEALVYTGLAGDVVARGLRRVGIYPKKSSVWRGGGSLVTSIPDELECRDKIWKYVIGKRHLLVECRDAH